MANENIKSLNDAENRIAELKRQISAYETQIKELETRSVKFVDNPSNVINKEITLSKANTIYIPTNDKNRHYSMKVEDLDKHFDQFHYPLYFHSEIACSIFDSIFPLINDLIKFKNYYDMTTDMTPTKANPVYLVYMDTNENVFKYRKVDSEGIPTIYFGTEEIAENCCTWLNYKYRLGNYSNRIG